MGRSLGEDSGALARPPLWAIAAVAALIVVGLRPNRREPPDGAEPREQISEGGADDGGRGRGATTPGEIPARGWKEIALRVYGNFSEHRILALAAGMTFYSLLAVFPALAALMAIYGLFFDPTTITTHVDQLSGILPGGALEIARSQMTRIASKGTQALGLTFAVSLAVSLWSANSAMKSLFDTLNVIYGEQEKRGFFKLNALSLSFTLGAIVFALAAGAGVVALPVAFQTFGVPQAGDALLRFGRWPALIVVLALALAAIYRYGPSRRTARWRWVTWGSALAAFLWLVASLLFSWYAGSFGNFNETYGSLGAVIGFMTWLWISATAVLLGAELDAEAEHQTERDTTETGQPMGRRGAKMADTVA
ncbi:membrane protein [Rhodoblastus acidophilus]|uniref:YihY/virulence factor BrkB family protein n=1 Tax=Rhodoblastus acidophilus TaxID=1074 RepID=UPI00222521DC|nr:YihY/virulence factor BrkB family protein [Rhodoblastus acidophilus]MCW2316553.1 membrane protein [Rhodoblastus acidophilus]